MKFHKNNKELYIVSEDVNCTCRPALHNRDGLSPENCPSVRPPDIKLCPVTVRTTHKNCPQSEVKDTICVSVVTMVRRESSNQSAGGNTGFCEGT